MIHMTMEEMLERRRSANALRSSPAVAAREPSPPLDEHDAHPSESVEEAPLIVDDSPDKFQVLQNELLVLRTEYAHERTLADRARGELIYERNIVKQLREELGDRDKLHAQVKTHKELQLVSEAKFHQLQKAMDALQRESAAKDSLEERRLEREAVQPGKATKEQLSSQEREAMRKMGAAKDDGLDQVAKMLENVSRAAEVCSRKHKATLRVQAAEVPMSSKERMVLQKMCDTKDDGLRRAADALDKTQARVDSQSALLQQFKTALVKCGGMIGTGNGPAGAILEVELKAKETMERLVTADAEIMALRLKIQTLNNGIQNHDAMMLEAVRRTHEFDMVARAANAQVERMVRVERDTRKKHAEDMKCVRTGASAFMNEFNEKAAATVKQMEKEQAVVESKLAEAEKKLAEMRQEVGLDYVPLMEDNGLPTDEEEDGEQTEIYEQQAEAVFQGFKELKVAVKEEGSGSAAGFQNVHVQQTEAMMGKIAQVYKKQKGSGCGRAIDLHVGVVVGGSKEDFVSNVKNFVESHITLDGKVSYISALELMTSFTALGYVVYSSDPAVDDAKSLSDLFSKEIGIPLMAKYGICLRRRTKTSRGFKHIKFNY